MYYIFFFPKMQFACINTKITQLKIKQRGFLKPSQTERVVQDTKLQAKLTRLLSSKMGPLM